MAKFIVEEGPDTGKTFVVMERKPFLIGRGAGAQLDIEDSLASRRHCQVEVRGDLFYARDLGSANGTFLNGRRITFAALVDGDCLRIGHTVLRFSTTVKGDSLIHREIAGLRFNALIGRGGMGTVYRAEQVSLGRQVACKVLSPELAGDPEFVALFLREARAAAALAHPNIVKVYDVGSADGLTYFTMEYISGGTVEERLACSGPLAIEEALRIAREAAVGLDYAAGRKLVHRDIKPGNLLVALDGSVKICDLGIAGTMDLEQEDSFRGGGSPHYIAPEQALGRPVDARADVYSLGVSLYAMLAGHPPFTGSSTREIARKHVTEPPPPLAAQRSGLPPEVCALVQWMMQKAPQDRPQSPAVVRDGLNALLAPPGAPPAVEGRRRAWRALAAAAAFVLLASALGAFAAHGCARRARARQWAATVAGAREKADALMAQRRYAETARHLAELLDAHPAAPGLEWVAPRIAESKRLAREHDAHLRAATADRELEALMPSGAGDDALAGFVARFEDTPAAGRAQHELARRAAEQAARLRHEEEAREEFARYRHRTGAYIEERLFAAAVDLWERFPAKYDGTAAHAAARDARDASIQMARTHMESVVREALERARGGDAHGAHALLAGLSLPEPLRPHIDAARAKAAALAREARESHAQRVHAQDLSLVAQAAAPLRAALRQADFRDAEAQLRALRDAVQTEAIRDEVIARLRGVELAGRVFRRVCLLPSPLSVKFPLVAGPPVTITRTSERSIEYYAREDDTRARRITWAELPPETFAALLATLDPRDEGAQAADVIRRELHGGDR